MYVHVGPWSEAVIIQMRGQGWTYAYKTYIEIYKWNKPGKDTITKHNLSETMEEEDMKEQTVPRYKATVAITDT